MNEAETRADLIDPALRKAGWGVVEGTRIRREYPINKGRLVGGGRRGPNLQADYVLVYKNRRLAVIEAKARDKYYTEGLGQAKDYAKRLQVRFTYATNGRQIYQVDMEEGMEQDVNSYPSPDQLWQMTFAEENSWRDRLLSVPFEDRGGTWEPRYYQENAVTKALEAVADGKDRILLTLATGTGKTAIAFQLAWKLYQSRWNLSAMPGKTYHSRLPRILFLADRNILADQAFNKFGAFEEDALVRIRPEDITKDKGVPTNGSLFFTIFQSFMSGPEGSPYFGEYPADFFDFIIIDECHRGGARDESTWRGIMEHFKPAVQLGLTATPKRDINRDTYGYFGDPVYTYPLKEGINDGFLSPFKVKEISTTIDTYTYTDDDRIEAGEIEYGKEYLEEEFNRNIVIREREVYRVHLFMDRIDQNQKTLVFCASQSHAAFIRDKINQYAQSRNVNYCVRVTANDGKRGEQFLRDFQDNEKTLPTILTTSQKLSTGVDAPEVRNIVLLRPINSMVEFKQIVGRGTRLYDGKDYFTIYDFVEAHEHFKDPEWDGPPLPPDDPTTGGEPRPCKICGELLCICEEPEPEPEPCPTCENDPCVCEQTPRTIIRVKLSNQKVRELDAMVKTSFWSPEGKPISAEAFVQRLFGDIPSLFENEEELRKLWSLPDTRRKLIDELHEKGYTHEQLEDLRKLVHGVESDLYDVLAYIAYHKDLVPRMERAERAKVYLNNYNPAQQEFLNFVLEQYVKVGVQELDDAKLAQLLTLKYHAIADAKRELGDIPSIRNAFIGFQGYLYGT
ncbi:MAG: DEAD/DEAH box helicase family protein [Bacteroidota bacterium]